MPIKTQVHILKLSASCPSVRTLVVFQDDKWTSPRKGYFMNQIFSLFLLSRHSDDCICFVSMVLLQWFELSRNILLMGSGLYSGL